MKIPQEDKAELFAHYWKILKGGPTPEREYRFNKDSMHRFDFAFPAQMVAVEVDGGQWVKNGGRHNRDSDREKLNIASMLGWKVFRFSPEMLNKNPDECVDQVKRGLLL